jgi:branched-chain amino acid transport system substrate-binding protein
MVGKDRVAPAADENTDPTTPVGPDADAVSALTRREFIQAAAVTGAVAGAGSVLGFPAVIRAQGKERPIKFGLLEDRSGNAAYQGIPKFHATQLAIKEINDGYALKGGPTGPGGLGAFGEHAAKPPTTKIKSAPVNDGGSMGKRTMIYKEEDEILVKTGDKGLLGRQIELIAPDTQTDNTRYQALSKRLILDDQVDVLMGAGMSSHREAIRPIMNQNKMLYVYNSQYEGGVADKYTFCTGALCEQQVIPVSQYMVDHFGKNIYIIAADYNFGQLTAMWTRAYAPILGAKVVGQENIPLQVSQFSSVIANIQKAKPSWLMVLLSGENHTNFYPQARAAGLSGLPMAATTNMMQGYEHIRFAPPAIANMHNAVEYMEEIPTPRNQAFVKRFRAMFPDEKYINELGYLSYVATHLWANAVRIAGTTDKEEVIKVLESGLGIEAPEGYVFMDPATHHLTHYIRLARSDERHNISFVREWPCIGPWWLHRLGVNLVRTAESKQYTPADDPYFKKYL